MKTKQTKRKMSDISESKLKVAKPNELSSDDDQMSDEEFATKEISTDQSDLEEEEAQNEETIDDDDDDCASSDDDDDVKKVQNFSLHELAQMRTKVPQKKLQTWVYGQKTASGSEKKKVKRDNKNRPQEVSMSALKAKKKKEAFLANHKQEKELQVWDPRFRPEVRGHVSKAMEALVEENKKKELRKLRNMFKAEENPQERQKIKFLIQRIKNQLVSKEQQREKEQEKKEAIQKTVEALRAGRKPFFQKKSATKKEPTTKKQMIRKESKRMKKEQYGVAFLKRKK